MLFTKSFSLRPARTLGSSQRLQQLPPLALAQKPHCAGHLLDPRHGARRLGCMEQGLFRPMPEHAARPVHISLRATSMVVIHLTPSGRHCSSGKVIGQANPNPTLSSYCILAHSILSGAERRFRADCGKISVDNLIIFCSIVFLSYSIPSYST